MLLQVVWKQKSSIFKSVIVTIILLSIQVSVFVLYYLPHKYDYFIISLQPDSPSLKIAFDTIIFYLLLFLSIICMLKVMLTDPGRVPDFFVLVKEM